MLSRSNRIVEASDFRHIVRRGEKHVAPHLIAYRVEAETTRVGIVVTSKCGNAVVRNTLRRQSRAVAANMIKTGALTGDVVFRFRCDGEKVDFATISAEFNQCAQTWARS